MPCRPCSSTTSPVLIDACPGAGKTRFGLECAARLFLEGAVNRVLIVAPTIRIVEQWVASGTGAGGGAVVPLAPAGWRPTQPLYQRWAGGVFTYHALFAPDHDVPGPSRRTRLQDAGDLRRDPPRRRRPRLGNGSPAGLRGGSHPHPEPVRHPVPHPRPRSIAFVETQDGKSIADYAYSYGDALADGVCRPLRFAAIGGTATFQTRRGGIETVSFDDDLNDRGESYRLLTVLAPDGDHLRRDAPDWR